MQPKSEQPLYKTQAQGELDKNYDFDAVLNVDTILSSHLSQTMPITNIANGPQLLTWNIMQQGTTNQTTAFQLKEDEKLHAIRLRRIAEALASEINKNPSIGIVTLQEVPDYEPARKMLLDILKSDPKLKDWDFDNVFYKKRGADPFGMMTLCNKKIVEKATEAPLTNLTNQKDRALAIDCTLKFDNKSHFIKVVNSHFCSTDEHNKFINAENIRAEINNIFTSTTGQVVLCGNFDKSLSFLSQTYGNLCYTNENPTSLFYSSEKLARFPVKENGFIFKEPPESFNLNSQPESAPKQPDPQPQVVTQFTKKISRATLTDHFTKGEYANYKVIFSTDNSKATLQAPDNNGNVEIKQKSDDQLEFTANSSSDKAIKTLMDAVFKCTTNKDVTLHIDAVGGTPEECEKVKNNLWLQAVQEGYSVDYQPPKKFIDALPKDKLPKNIKLPEPVSTPTPTPKP